MRRRADVLLLFVLNTHTMAKKKASKLVSAAILGLDGETVVIAGKAYYIAPPTIKRIAQAAYYLSDLREANTMYELFMSIGDVRCACSALSCLIEGDESLTEDLMQGTIEEVSEALEIAYSLASVENFYKLSALARNVASLTAKQRL